MAPVVALVVGATALVWCGAPPWRSRVLSLRLGRVTRGGRRVTFLALAVVATAASVTAVVAHGSVAHAAMLGATVVGGAAVAMAGGAVRQWRLAPRARAQGAAVVVLAAVLVAVYPLAADGSRWWSPTPLLVALAAIVVTTRDSVARSDAAAAFARRTEREHLGWTRREPAPSPTGRAGGRRDRAGRTPA